MNNYLSLTIATILPVILTTIIELLEKAKKLNRFRPIQKQIVIGILFGGLAILGTEWGIPINGAQVNCRDAAVLCGGLFFGPWAGIIAGLIGGIERWIAVAWGVGSFTRVACSISTIIAGFYSAYLRKFLFEDKKPEDIFAFASGIVMEVFHLTMVFLTNLSDATRAMQVVKACTVPMITANAVAVMASSIILKIIDKDHKYRTKGKETKRISIIIQKAIFSVIVLMFFATSAFTISLQKGVSEEELSTDLSGAITDVVCDVEDIHSKYGEDADIQEQLTQAVRNRRIGNTGYVLVTDENYRLISGPTKYTATNIVKEMSELEASSEDFRPGVVLKGKFMDDECYCMFVRYERYVIVSVKSCEEAEQVRNIAIYANLFMEVLAFAVMFCLVSMLVQNKVVLNIKRVNRSLKKISAGDLDEVVDIQASREFHYLSDDINKTVDTLKGHINDAAARIEADLAMATEIQMSALPTMFPAFPNRKDFDIYAQTRPAKEVGGDFFDLYLTHSKYLNFMVADVSGKGIPAAMFMMRAKTILQSLTKSDLYIEDVFTQANDSLCEGNAGGMFVTCWQGGMDLRTGIIEYANAGHNPPVVKHANGQFEYLKSKVNLVLAGMSGIPYKRQELQLEPGDIVFLYTDGVTEATDAHNELYGEERLLKVLNSMDFVDMQDLCNHVQEDVDAFVADAPQFDDITMLAFKYYGHGAPRWHSLPADRSEVPGFTIFVDKWLETMGCPIKAQTQIDVAIDEIMTNIASYAYGDKCGRMGVVLQEIDEPQHGISLSFVDNGYAYNPLEHEDPDITLSAEERDIGGLGILMVKKTMDEVIYERVNGTNVLTIKKYFSKDI